MKSIWWWSWLQQRQTGRTIVEVVWISICTNCQQRQSNGGCFHGATFITKYCYYIIIIIMYSRERKFVSDSSMALKTEIIFFFHFWSSIKNWFFSFLASMLRSKYVKTCDYEVTLIVKKSAACFIVRNESLTNIIFLLYL